MAGKDLRLYTEPDPPPRRESSGGLFRSGFHQFQTWYEEKYNEAEVRRLNSQQRLLEARRSLMEAEHQALQAVHTAAADTDEAASERAFRRTLRMVTPGEAYRLLRLSVEEENQLLLREQIRRCRLHPGVAALPEGIGFSGRSQDGLEVDISPQQIERLALRAVTQFQALPEVQRQAAYAEWARKLEGEFPAYAVAEITQRAEELRDLL